MAPSESSDGGSSSDEDNDIPLSKLSTKKRNRSPAKYKEGSFDDDEEVEFEDDGEEYAEADDDYDDGGDAGSVNNDEESDDDDDEYSGSDDDDGIPLSQMSKKLKSTPQSVSKKSKQTKTKTKTNSKTKTKTKTKSKTTKKKKKKKVVTKRKPKRGKTIEPSSTSTIVTPSSELYSKCAKGKLIQYLLCRWWYVFTWPDPSSLPKSPPKNCDSLDGFPGVYIHTSGEEVGKLVDYRDKSTCPNFKNMVNKSSAELKELLLKAIEVQMEQLIENEGEGTTTQKDLRDLQKWVKKVSVQKADDEARAVLRAAGFAKVG